MFSIVGIVDLDVWCGGIVMGLLSVVLLVIGFELLLFFVIVGVVIVLCWVW